jgi:hypothetical protein
VGCAAALAPTTLYRRGDRRTAPKSEYLRRGTDRSGITPSARHLEEPSVPPALRSEPNAMAQPSGLVARALAILAEDNARRQARQSANPAPRSI